MKNPAQKQSVYPLARRSCAGVTLVELSIVLVILALIIGAVVGGRALIDSSKERAFISEVQSYISAVESFRGKYEYLPGDLPNATDYWGAVDSGDGLGTDCTQVTTNFTRSTCNGNGDGSIRWVNDATYHYEIFSMWKHLVSAGFLTGSFHGGYSGTHSITSFVPGSSIPESKYYKPSGYAAGFSLLYIGTPHDAGSTSMYDGTAKHVMFFGADAFPRFGTIAKAITPHQAWGIDSKMDDGLPARGAVKTTRRGFTYGTTPICSGSLTCTDVCATTDIEATAQYDLDVNTIECSLYFFQNF